MSHFFDHFDIKICDIGILIPKVQKLTFLLPFLHVGNKQVWYLSSGSLENI